MQKKKDLNSEAYRNFLKRWRKKNMCEPTADVAWKEAIRFMVNRHKRNLIKEAKERRAKKMEFERRREKVSFPNYTTMSFAPRPCDAPD